MNLYISDLHFGHRNVIGFDHRPFKDCEEMDTAMIRLWNSRVAPDDDVYVIGDFSYKSDKDEAWYLQRLRGHKHLIIGNHDGKLLQNERAMHYFDSVDKMTAIVDNGNQIILCHYPMAEWYKSHNGTWLIYGHIHNKRENTYEYMKNLDRALNAAACINNYTPVSFRELVRNNEQYKNSFEGTMSNDPDMVDQNMNDEKKTYYLIHQLVAMKHRRGMYFSQENCYGQLMALLMGYALGTNLYERQDAGQNDEMEVLSWSSIQSEVDRRVEVEHGYQEFKGYSDGKKFDIYMNTIFKVYAEKYPESAKELGIR